MRFFVLKSESENLKIYKICGIIYIEKKAKNGLLIPFLFKY